MEKQNAISDEDSITNYLEWSDANKNGILRYILGTFLVLFSFMVLAGIGGLPVMILDPNFKKSAIESNLALLSCFIIPFVLIPLIAHWIHKRPWWSVAMPKLRFEKWNLFMGFFVFTVIGLIVTLLFGQLGILKLHFVGMDWGAYLPLLFVGGIGIFIQSGSEELLFRGYLTQFTRRISKHPFVYIIIPAFLFAYPHIGNISEMGGNIWAIAPYLIMGILFGWTAYKTGSLWMSLGIHWSNNLTGMVLIGVKGDKLQTVAPIVLDMPSLEVVTLLTLLQAILTVIAILYLLRHKKTK